MLNVTKNGAKTELNYVKSVSFTLKTIKTASAICIISQYISNIPKFTFRRPSEQHFYKE